MKSNVYKAMCTVCGDNQNVASGIGAMKVHEKRSQHLNDLEKSKNQLHFAVNK